MKTLKTLYLPLLILALTFLPMMASADAVEIDGIYYNLIPKAKQAEVTSNPNKYTGDVVIPDVVTYQNVEYSVTSIGESAFEECSRLTSVTIPNSVISIEMSAFQWCSNLTSIDIPNSVTSIEMSAFSNCPSLTSIRVEPGNTKYDSRDNCNGIIETETNTLITGCRNTTIPNSVTSIGDYAFSGCRLTFTIDIPNSVTSIGDYAFCYCTLTTIDIPNSVTSIGEDAFFGCGLTTIDIPNSVTSIGGSAFYDCWSLTSIDIPNSVTNIGAYAFYNCYGLTSVTIPNSVTSIGDGAFVSCSGLTSVTIPNSVTSIGGSAFYDCRSLTSVTIPNSVTSIGSCAFQWCSNLTSIDIPNSVTIIEMNTFYGCSSLTSVTIPHSVTLIDVYAFKDCTELTDFYCYAEDIPETDSWAFDNTNIRYATLHVPDASVENYKKTSPWSGFGIIVGLEGVEIPKCATPTIYYSNGKLSYKSETEGATFNYMITDTDIQSGSGNEVQLTVTYHISVYASKEGYQDSDVAEATLCWIEVDPQKEGITEETATDAKQMKAMPVLIQANDGQISVEGAPEGTPISVYNLSGQMVGSATASAASTTIGTALPNGEVVVVKIGEKAVKIKVQKE